ncbi:AAA family ATPase [Paucibacter sp. DJ1R-11]|uniref:ATP-dependent nuclease n=1 Tax=Paucibacter sp. DJ1R-11 TaxID=2893556 RepID=UPI0021E3610C|nr:AAA family ATPase [Paucibacter sp. DJ1R-11]MCV2364878.1 AAA family ATPase [Paucibacter sp. DJ1R-11]
MPDPRQELQRLFGARQRYSNFGPALAKIIIRGFRGLDELSLSIESPITAISGLNGTGKSTVAQLATAAYKKPVTESEKYKRHIIANYFPVSKADPKPFRDDASIEYQYFTASPERLQELTVTRRRGSQWEGYKRQPERHCRYIGFTIYIPKVEQRDISIYRGQEISITNEAELPDSARLAISRILNHPYENLSSATAAHAMRSAEIGFAKKFGAKYSENNMGFGEGRVFYTVNSLETAPEQSLFVIEEPETSLHEHAQHELAKYLIEVCLRRKHQIILTTHSRSILNALPRQSRKLLYRDGSKVCVSDRTSSAEATGQLALGHARAKTVLVEDARAKVLLTELVRATKPVLLRGVTITFVGNDDVVASMTKRFRDDGLPVVGVRDGDRGENTRQGLLKLPGTQSPEQEVFGSSAVTAHLQTRYGLNWSEWSALHQDMDFHDWPNAIATELTKTEDGLWEELSAVYAAACPVEERARLVENIEA